MAWWSIHAACRTCRGPGLSYDGFGASVGLTFDTLDSCARAMNRLQEDPVLRRDLGGQGQATAGQKCTPDAYTTRFSEIIGELQRS